uniref:1,4-dihydroxy-2-naphthoate octaprenyltransferase n=1 Tax=Thermosporothrix sp. COM3 TaxID=2490863 RepID=A0A455SPB2_9CHLR|nr:hypothetical protein KTC_42970 [Thermosporothrix sp. COM3]
MAKEKEKAKEPEVVEKARQTETHDTEREEKQQASTQVVTAEAVRAEEVPTIAMSSLQAIDTLKPEVVVHSVEPTNEVEAPVPLIATTGEYKRSIGEWVRVWWDGLRPAYLSLALLPLLVGSALAWTQTISKDAMFGHFRLLHFLGALIGVLLLQLGANLINDYYDYVHGVDTSNTLGPGGLIQQGLIKPVRVLIVGLVLLGLGAVIGAVVAFAGGPLVYGLGLLGVLGAYFYSATTKSLSALFLGELVAFLIYGPLITLGAYLIQGGKAPLSAIIYSLPAGLLAAAIILMNNMRDIEGDQQARKYTVATGLGIKLSRYVYLVLVLAAYTVVIVLGVPPRAPHWILLALWSLPSLFVAISGVLRTDVTTGFQLVLRTTLKLERQFLLLLVLGMVIAALLPLVPNIPMLLLP